MTRRGLSRSGAWVAGMLPPALAPDFFVSLHVLARLDRVIALSIVLMPMARPGRP